MAAHAHGLQEATAYELASLLERHPHVNMSTPLSQWPTMCMLGTLQTLRIALRNDKGASTIGNPNVRLRSWRALCAQLAIFPLPTLSMLLVAHQLSWTRAASPTTTPEHIAAIHALRQLGPVTGPDGAPPPLRLTRLPSSSLINSWELAVAIVILQSLLTKSHSARNDDSSNLRRENEQRTASQATHAFSPISQKSLHPFAHLPCGIVHWNVRTLAQLQSPLSKKIRLIRQWTASKRIVCLNETHWAERLEDEFMQCTQTATFATTCGESNKGGVAIIIDRSIEPAVIQTRVLVPGYAIAIVFAGAIPAASCWTKPFVLIAIYADPQRKVHIINALTQGLLEWHSLRPEVAHLPCLLIGDVNTPSPGLRASGYSGSPCDDCPSATNERLAHLEDTFSLAEAFPRTDIPSWRRSSYAQRQASATLDRTFCSHHRHIEVRVLCSADALSDHRPIEVVLSSSLGIGAHQQNSASTNGRTSGRAKEATKKLLTQPMRPEAFKGEKPSLQLLRTMLHITGAPPGSPLHFCTHSLPQSLPHSIEGLAEVQKELLTPIIDSHALIGEFDPWLRLKLMSGAARTWWLMMHHVRAARTASYWQELVRTRTALARVADDPARTALVDVLTAQLTATLRAMAAAHTRGGHGDEYSQCSRSTLYHAAAADILQAHPNASPIAQATMLIEWADSWPDAIDDKSFYPKDTNIPGSSAKPKELPAHMKLARRIFPKLVASLPPTDNDGQPFKTPSHAEAAFRSSRVPDIWTALDNVDSTLVQSWMDVYREHFVGLRDLSVDIPSVEEILSAVLQAGPSAPGIDGVPYEVWHIAPLLTARLLHLVFLMLRDDPMACQVVALISVDVVVFIPKAAGLTHAATHRPLAIPITILRLLSASGMKVVARPWADMLHQGASALPGKGDCSANVRTIQAFLDWFPSEPKYAYQCRVNKAMSLLPSALRDLWTCLRPLLDAAGPLRTMAFVDQVKAYEVIGYEWLKQCWASWSLPAWVWQWLHAIVLNRSVRIRVSSFMGPILKLIKGLGMGGPHAPLQWSIGFDPIVWALDVIANSHLTSVFADDTALANTSMQPMIIGQLLLAASHSAAGLRIAYHRCVHLSLIVNLKRSSLSALACIRLLPDLRSALASSCLVQVVELEIVHFAEELRVTIDCQSPIIGLLLVMSAWHRALFPTIDMPDLPSLLRYVSISYTRDIPCRCTCKCDLLFSPLTATLAKEEQQLYGRIQQRNNFDTRAACRLPFPAASSIDKQALLLSQCSPVNALQWLADFHSGRASMYSGLVPDDQAARFEADFCIWGASTLATHARYLGPSVTIPGTGNLAYEQASKKPLAKMQLRTNTAVQTRTSFPGAVYTWNMHILSCMPHIWSAIYVTPALLAPVRKLARAALRTQRWTTPEQLFAVSAVLRIAGFPVDHNALAQAAFAAAVIKDDMRKLDAAISLRGPANPLGKSVQDEAVAAHIFRHALSASPIDACIPAHLVDVLNALRLKLQEEIQQCDAGAPRIKQLRRALLQALQAQAALAPRGAMAQLIGRSTSRTFGATDGTEWSALAEHAHNLNAHICYDLYRAWLNGYWDCRKMRWSDSLLKHAVPLHSTACLLCQYGAIPVDGIKRPRFLPCGWKSGLTLCQACITDFSRINCPPESPLWANIFVAQAANKTIADKVLSAASCQTADFLTNSATQWAPLASLLTPDMSGCCDKGDAVCPLCFTGEQSTEHLMWWCPVVLGALSTILCRVIDPLKHQPFYLCHLSSIDAQRTGWLWRSVTLLISRFRRTLPSALLARGSTAFTQLQQLCWLWWQNLPGRARPACMPIGVADLIRSLHRITTHGTRKAPICEAQLSELSNAHGVAQQVRPTLHEGAPLRHLDITAAFSSAVYVNQACPPGTLIASTCASTNPLLWPLLGHAGQVLPRLRMVREGDKPNAQLRATTCSCGARSISVIALQVIPEASEVVVGFLSPIWTPGCRSAYVAIMFDGSTPTPRAATPYSGAGVVAILHLPNGHVSKLATLHLSLPDVRNAQIAEAFGARYAFRLLLTAAKAWAQEHLISGVVIRGDSRVVTMDQNGHGLVKAAHMSQVLLPLKSWAAACPLFKGCQHIVREYNPLADVAAGQAAEHARVLMHAKHLPHHLMVEHKPDESAAFSQAVALSLRPKGAELRLALTTSSHELTPGQAALLLSLASGLAAVDVDSPVGLAFIEEVAKALPKRTCAAVAHHASILKFTSARCGILSSVALVQWMLHQDVQLDIVEMWLGFMTTLSEVNHYKEQCTTGDKRFSPTLQVIHWPYTLTYSSVNGIFAYRPLGLPASAGDLDFTGLAL